jgi:probable F420-dependent oxidoreductase
MRYGIIFSGGGTTIQQMAGLAKQAEDAGLDSVYLCEAWRSGFVGLAAIAQATQRIEIGTYILNTYGRSPWLAAMSAVDLDELSGGRLVLGIGIGGEDPHEFASCGVDPRHRGARANEALQVLRRLWEEDHVTFSGRHFDLHDVTVYPKPLRPVPLFVGGRSDAALLRAGRYGDGYTGIWQSVERFVQAQEMIAEAALAAGRDPAAIEPGMQFWTSVGPGSEGARERVAEGMHATYRLPFERFERYTPFGTAAEVADFIAPYVEAGARHINLIHVQDTPEETVERAAEVREALRELTA